MTQLVGALASVYDTFTFLSDLDCFPDSLCSPVRLVDVIVASTHIQEVPCRCHMVSGMEQGAKVFVALLFVLSITVGQVSVAFLFCYLVLVAVTVQLIAWKVFSPK